MRVGVLTCSLTRFKKEKDAVRDLRETLVLLQRARHFDEEEMSGLNRWCSDLKTHTAERRRCLQHTGTPVSTPGGSRAIASDSCRRFHHAVEFIMPQISPRARFHHAPDSTLPQVSPCRRFHPAPDFTTPQVSLCPSFPPAPVFPPPQISAHARFYPAPDFTPHQIYLTPGFTSPQI